MYSSKHTPHRSFTSLAALAIFALGAPAVALAGPQFSFLDPGYTQSIFTLPQSGLGLTFSGGQLVTRDDILSNPNDLKVYSLLADTTYQGTSVHSFTAHNVTGLGSGRGLTTGLDGFIYANTSSGITKINPTTFSVAQVYASAAGSYGITTMSDGRIAHTDSSNVWVLDPVTGIDSLIYSAGSFIDGIAVDPSSGSLFLADLGQSRVRVISSTGSLINSVAVAHSPDGMAFGSGSAYANNTDGTITKLSFAGPGFTGAVTETIFASGGAYGDFATVGPDGAFYVSQYGPSGGIHWDNGATTSDIAIVRIAKIGGGGFDPGPGTPPDSVPDSGMTATLLGLAIATLFGISRRFRARVS